MVNNGSISFANPYGINAILYVFKVLKDNVFSFITIAEQQPLTFGRPTIELYLIFMAVFIIFIVIMCKKELKYQRHLYIWDLHFLYYCK